MKLSKLMPLAAMALMVGFSSCNGEDDPKPGNVVYDGMYLLGDATVSTTPDARLLMAAGINEAAEGKPTRDGMYEKYIALEAGKDFYFQLHTEGVGDVKYGADDFAASKLPTDGDSIPGYSGTIKIGGTPFRVTESGLYHVVLDLDKDAGVGKQLVLVAPCSFGFRGAMNGWGYSAFTKGAFNKETITFTSEETPIRKDDIFKFAYGDFWKIVLDQERGAVKAEVSLGAGLVTGADNIAFDKADGIYTTVLTWSLAAGANSKSFKVEYNKVKDIPVADYSSVLLELVGSGVDETNTGAVADASSWAWGYTLKAINDGKPTLAGNVYTWKWNNVTLKAEGFKIRTVNYLAYGDINAFDCGTEQVAEASKALLTSTSSDIVVAEAGAYNISLAIDAAANTKTITLSKN
jgi:hypothetical protein